jgi:hypothetical protein
MKKADRKRNKRIRIQNKKLCKKYLWLIPRNRWTGKICWDQPYEFTELDDMPSGWRKAFGDIWCEEYQKVLKKENRIQEFRVEQIKEKFGQLRFYHNGGSQELHDLTWCFEYISEYICVRCGKLNSPVINNYGWYEPLCKQCYEKESSRYKQLYSYQERLEEAGVESIDDMLIPTSVTLNTYSKGKDTTRIIDMSNLVAKIRYKNRKKKNNVLDCDFDSDKTIIK